MTTMTTIEYAYRRFCQTRFPLPSEEKVADLEKRIGVVFPEDYRDFLLEFNGGWFIDPGIDAPSEGCPDDALNCLYGIGATIPDAELCSPSDLALFTENDPAQIVPIGDTLMGGLIILITRADGPGQIMLKKAFGGFFFLAHGIEEFFELLREPTDE